MALTVTILLIVLLGPVYAQQKGWEKEWNEAMAGGKKECKVVVATSPDRLYAPVWKASRAQTQRKGVAIVGWLAKSRRHHKPGH